MSNNLVFRYNVEHTQDGLVGEEGTFSICTFWVSCSAGHEEAGGRELERIHTHGVTARY